MNISQTKEMLTSQIADFIDTCPHCDALAHFQMLFNDAYKTSEGHIIYYVVFRCVPCRKLMLKTIKFEQNSYGNNENLKLLGWQDKFPGNEIVYINKFQETVPVEVLDDFEEGVISLHNQCNKASVSMFRRTLQSALLDLGADPKKELINQINEMTNLTQDIKDWAHNIRIFGNWGAHPQEDNLKEVNEDIANEVRMFIEEFFNYVYVMPGRVAKARGTGKPQEEEK